MVSAPGSGLIFFSGLGLSPGWGTALCSWTRHYTLLVPHSFQVYKCILMNLMLAGNNVMEKHPIQGGGGGGGGGGSRILLTA